jgi:hypothetical protein
VARCDAVVDHAGWLSRSDRIAATAIAVVRAVAEDAFVGLDRSLGQSNCGCLLLPFEAVRFVFEGIGRTEQKAFVCLSRGWFRIFSGVAGKHPIDLNWFLTARPVGSRFYIKNERYH